MKSLGRFEADLLHLLHALLGRAPIERALAVLKSKAARREPPACLSAAAVGLIRDALAKTYVARLAGEGGWRRERFLRGDRVASGRLWERTPPEELAPRFSRQTLEFLLRLACRTLDGWAPPPAALTVGDRVIFFWAYEALRPTDLAAGLRRLGPFRTHGLCRLAFPDDFAQGRGAAAVDLVTWTVGPGACVLEAIQPFLAGRWHDIERSKARIDDPARLRALARAQVTIRDALLAALDAAGRRDLARFFLDAAAELLREGPGMSEWLDPEMLKGLRLAERTTVQRSALVLFDTVGRLRSWEREARTVGYFDDGYAAAQLWMAEWEARGGGALDAEAGEILRRLDPLRQTQPPRTDDQPERSPR